MGSLLAVGLGNALGGAGLVPGVALLGRLLRRAAPRHGLWLVVLVKLVTPPFATLPIARPPVAVVATPEVEVVAIEPIAAEGPIEVVAGPVPAPSPPSPVRPVVASSWWWPSWTTIAGA